MRALSDRMCTYVRTHCSYVQAHCSRYVHLCAAIPVPMCTYVRCMVSMISRLARTVRMCRGGGVCACRGGHYVQHPALNSDRVCACMCAQLFACAVCVFVCQPLVGNTTQQSTAGPAHTPAHTPPQITAHTPKKPTCTYPLVSRKSGGIETSAWYALVYPEFGGISAKRQPYPQISQLNVAPVT